MNTTYNERLRATTACPICRDSEPHSHAAGEWDEFYLAGFRPLTNTTLGDTTIMTAQQITNTATPLVWTLVSTADGDDIIVMPNGLHRRAEMVEPGTTTAAFVQWAMLSA